MFYMFLRYTFTKLNNNQCSGYAIPTSILKPVARIIVIGDIHSDLKASIKIFKKCKLIDDNHKWIAEPKDTIVVQLGDQIDGHRPGLTHIQEDCMSDIQVLRFFYNIHQDAVKYGGGVYSLLGNHEIMNLQGIFNYVSKGGFNEFDGYSKRMKSFAQNGEYNKLLACTRNTILKIGSWLFVHGGIVPTISDKYNIEELNNIIRQWILNRESISNNSLLNDKHNSPFWNRHFGKIQTNLPMEHYDCQKMRPIMEAYDIGRIVVAHTPQMNGINATCDNRVWRTDVGISSVFQQNFKNLRGIQIMEILNDTQVKIINV